MFCSKPIIFTEMIHFNFRCVVAVFSLDVVPNPFKKSDSKNIVIKLVCLASSSGNDFGVRRLYFTITRGA